MGLVDDAYARVNDNDGQFVGAATTSVTLGELVTDGFVDFSNPTWDFPKYSEEQHRRLCDKIVNHYWSRDIGVLPPRMWKCELLRKLDEIMPKYVWLYKKLDSGIDSLNATDEAYKARDIVSDFPQTQLSGNEDYASMGTDREYERIRDGTILDLVDRIRSYDDVDLMVINELESMFSCLFSVNVDAW